MYQNNSSALNLKPIIHHLELCTSQNNLSSFNGNMIWGRFGLGQVKVDRMHVTAAENKRDSEARMPWCFNRMPLTWRTFSGCFELLSSSSEWVDDTFFLRFQLVILCLDRPICWCFKGKCSEFILSFASLMGRDEGEKLMIKNAAAEPACVWEKRYYFSSSRLMKQEGKSRQNTRNFHFFEYFKNFIVHHSRMHFRRALCSSSRWSYVCASRRLSIFILLILVERSLQPGCTHTRRSVLK